MIEVVNMRNEIDGYAEEGFKVVAIEILIDNVGEGTDDYNFACFEAKSPKGCTFGPGTAPGLPFLEYGSLAAGEKARGWISFEIPEETSVGHLKITCDRAVERNIRKQLKWLFNIS